MPEPTQFEDFGAPYSSLVARWNDTFGPPPPKNLSRRLLVHALAHAAQAAIQGTLPSPVTKQLRALAVTSQSEPPRYLNAGARLVREWNGRTYVVDVTDDGFVMDRRTFQSLSAVAKAITGAHWSGRAFFGLTKRKK